MLAFNAPDKSSAFGKARAAALASAAGLLMEADPVPAYEAAAKHIATELISKLGGLIASQERRGRGGCGRFEQFASQRR
ncbi:MAG: hypothetical protein GKR94_19265 [Gammaproteobacteria bacterium]|nr:hypothetical protein [Gammaproteobacteria bacterium]